MAKYAMQSKWVIVNILRRPTAGCFVFLVFGIIFSHYVNLDFLIVLSAAVILAFLAGISAIKFARFFPALFFALIFASGVLLHSNFHILSKDNIRNVEKSEGVDCYLNGIVESLPSYAWQKWGQRRCSFLFSILHYDNGNTYKKARGLAWVTIRDNDTEYDSGDNLIIRGTIKRTDDSMADNGRGSYLKYLYLQGVHCCLDVRDDDDIAPSGRPRGFFPAKCAHKLSRGMEKRIKRYLPYPDSALLNAMLLGRREFMPPHISDLFIRTGTMHILSVSGLHVGLLSSVFFFCLKLFRLPKKYIITIVIFFLWIYAFIAGSRSPVVRASVMISVYLLSVVLERDFDIFSALFFAGLLILLINPMQLFNAGFQLSFACVFFIVYLCPKLESAFLPSCFRPDKSIRQKNTGKFMPYLFKTFFSSLAVFTGVWPLVAYHFGIISPVTIIANLFVVPLLAVLLTAGIILVCIPGFFWPLAYAFSCLNHALFYLLLRIVKLFAGLPYAFFNTEYVPLWLIGVYYIILLIVAEALPDRKMM
ncbi:ComEC family competence protein [bacterium]|nr:ComEC family competence protein [bacterium]